MSSPTPAPNPAVSLEPVLWFSTDQICASLPPVPTAAAAARRVNVESNWPLIAGALAKHCDTSRLTAIAAIATTSVETGSFAPVKERGGPGYFTKLYWDNQAKARELGNLSAADAVAFCGRGFVQITGRANYHAYGRAIGIDLCAEPARALEAPVAAEILALYFRDHHVAAAAAALNWTRVRRLVNGGLNGWADFIHVINALIAIPAGSDN